MPAILVLRRGRENMRTELEVLFLPGNECASVQAFVVVTTSLGRYSGY